MKQKCIICGKTYDVNRPLWEKVLKPKNTYICELCKARIQYEAKEAQVPPKPM
ncbi:MAG: DUF2197 domain-containing protein [Bacillota bacterium]|nr:DUF2197 domain-containing protein [Bacillota bacterium]